MEALSLARCGAATDADVAAAAAALHSLRAIDLSRCALVGDPALATLCRYRRSAEADEPGDDEAEAAAALAEALRRSRLDGSSAAAQPAAAAAGAGPAVLESPQDAVRRIASEKDAAFKARTAASPAAAAAAAAGIETICVSGSAVSSRGVADALRGASRAPSLTTLDVSRCPKVTGDALDPGPRSLLRVLRGNGCSALRALSFALPAGSALAEVSLADCRSLVDVDIAAPALLDLNLSGCSALSSLALRCPRLARLRASGCSSLHLGAAGAPLDCPRLLTLSLFGCRSVDSAGFEAMLPSLTAVEDLDISGCSSLGRVVAASGDSLSQLRRVAADGCAALRHIAIAAPLLRELSARSCPRLVEVSLVGAAPRALNFEICHSSREGHRNLWTQGML